MYVFLSTGQLCKLQNTNNAYEYNSILQRECLGFVLPFSYNNSYCLLQMQNALGF